MAVPLNLWAIVGAVVAIMALGFLWFGPLFGKPWTRMMGHTSELMEGAQKGVLGKYLIQMLGAVFMVFVLAHNLAFGSAYLNMSGVPAGLQAAFWNWLGFVVPVTLGVVLWEGKPWKLWMITAGYYLVGLGIAGTILAIWS